MNNHVMSNSSLPDAEDGILSKKMKLDDGSGNEMHDDDDVQGNLFSNPSHLYFYLIHLLVLSWYFYVLIMLSILLLN